MGKIIACIDGSAHADSVCTMGAWAVERAKFDITLLHVVAPHSDVAAKGDLSGQIGLGAKSELLEELAKVDEEHGKLELKKGQIMLKHAAEELALNGINGAEMLHRRGSVVETIAELEPQADLIIMGKRGEHAAAAPDHLGSNLERVARSIHKPLLVVPRKTGEVSNFLIAYDGSTSSQKAIDQAIGSPLLKGLCCHLIKISDATSDTEKSLSLAEEKLKSAGFDVTASLKQGKSVEDVVAGYVTEHNIQLLVIGAYGHSKIRSLILGSTTSVLIRKSTIPVLLFR